MANEVQLKIDTVNLAKTALTRINLLIEQCNNWLPEEEGRLNMEKKILKKWRKKRLKSL